MLLTRLAKCGRDSGSALVAVIGVMAVGLILTTLIATQLVGAMGHSTATRAGVQSHASADAGIAAAQTALFTPGSCAAQSPAGTYTSTAPPIYTVTVEYNAGAGWLPGCPPITATQVRLVATGTASMLGVAGVSRGDTTKVETVLDWKVPGPVPSGPAVYLYKGGEITANSSFDLQDGDGTGLMIKNGDLTCNKNNGLINGSVAIFGNLTLSNKCSISKNASVTGTASLGNGSVGGELAAGTILPSPLAPGQAGSINPVVTMPDVPKWADVNYVPADWKRPDGSQFEVQPAILGLGCILSSGNMGDSTGKAVIYDARGCIGGMTATNNTVVSLTSDVVIFAESFNFTGLNSVVFKSSSAATHRLWFITPDYLDDDQPTCKRPALLPVWLLGDQGDFSIKNGFEIQSPIQAMLYTPCSFEGKTGFVWNGQIYAGDTSHLLNNPKFTPVEMGIAGQDLGDGDPDPDDLTKPQPGTVISMRDVN